MAFMVAFHGCLGTRNARASQLFFFIIKGSGTETNPSTVRVCSPGRAAYSTFHKKKKASKFPVTPFITINSR